LSNDLVVAKPDPEQSSPPASTAGGPEAAGRFSRWLREPLMLFLVVGVALFAVFRAVHPEAFNRAASNRIVLTPDDLRQMSVQWAAQGRPQLTPAEWRSLIDTKVREEVLFREAVALGLDRDDTIVKRRMVQKMEFLAQDVAAAREPTSADLRQWFGENTARFVLPPRISFRHLYFSFDKRGQRARDDAGLALRGLGSLTVGSPAASKLADPFMFQDEYAERTPDQIAKEFGPAFARSLFQLKPGAWQGPVESGYGWHLIVVASLIPERLPDFEEVEPEVKADWIAEQGELAKRRAYEAMRARYEVVLPEQPAEGPAKSR
jgi:peptidyl-prolyl cis-trans isomerase C